MDFFNDERIQKIVEIVEIVLLMIIIGLLVWDRFFRNVAQEDTNSQETVLVKDEEKETPAIVVEPKDYQVDIKGSVKNPGVYVLKEGSIINDLINAAGGIKSGGTVKNINLSKKIEDEMVVYIYTTNELNRLKVDVNETKECVCPTYNISSCEGSSVVKTSGSNSTSTTTNETKPNTEVANGKVNINTDGIDKLTTLTGIGEAKAKAIIEYRESNGGFKSIEEIKNISGIGDASFEKIKDNITI